MADKNEGSWMKQLAAEMLAFGRYIKASLADPAQREAIGRTLGIALSPLGATPSPSPTSDVTAGESSIAQYIDGEDIDILALLDAFAEQGASWRTLEIGTTMTSLARRLRESRDTTSAGRGFRPGLSGIFTQ